MNSGIIEYAYNGKIRNIGYLKNNATKRVEIYQDKKDLTQGYRIYKDYNIVKHEPYLHQDDLGLIKNLHIYGKNVQKTTFPYGVVTLDKAVIGQIIPYYDNSVSLLKMLSNSSLNVYTWFLKAYEIIQELYDNDIIYIDIHGNNFLVLNNELKIIDFEPGAVYFKDKSFQILLMGFVLDGFIKMIQRITYYKCSELIPNLTKVKSLEQLHNELLLGEELTLKKTR